MAVRLSSLPSSTARSTRRDAARSTLLSLASSRARTKRTTSASSMTSKTPSEASTRNSSSGPRTWVDSVGSALNPASLHGEVAPGGVESGEVMHVSRSPNARVTSTRPRHSTPWRSDSRWRRAASLGLAAVWLVVRGTAMPLREATARASPTLATMRVSSQTVATTAVAPLSTGCGAEAAWRRKSPSNLRKAADVAAARRSATAGCRASPWLLVAGRCAGARGTRCRISERRRRGRRSLAYVAHSAPP
mmetsp:Transcript_53407/g.125624  ORF Transcript_53407/g.125624 Transcript_53407/m.125624 type:complete len:248 (+) Transcript_53407:241-984(+)